MDGEPKDNPLFEPCVQVAVGMTRLAEVFAMEGMETHSRATTRMLGLMLRDTFNGDEDWYAAVLVRAMTASLAADAVDIVAQRVADRLFQGKHELTADQRKRGVRLIRLMREN